MTGLYYAEWKKISGNRLLVGCSIWIWPLVACVGVGMYSLALWLNESARQNFEPIAWTEIALLPWLAINNPVGRLLLIGFCAAVFAGEYQYQTWKTILPGNRRLTLILVKYLAVTSFIVVALGLTTFLLLMLVGAMHWSLGEFFGPALSGAMMADFLPEFGAVVLAAVLNSLLIGGAAILVTLYTRTILFGVMAGVAVALIDWLGIPTILALVSSILGVSEIETLVVLTPSFNLENLRYWVMAGEPLTYLGTDFHVSWVVSVVVLGLWLGGLIGLSAAIFQRQDL